MPSTPAPKSIEPVQQYLAGVSLNPFTGQEQIHDWNAFWLELTVTMPPMDPVTGLPWINFLIACKGRVNTFQISNPGFLAQIPAAANVNGNWRLKTNSAKWSVNDATIVGMSFEIREAL